MSITLVSDKPCWSLPGYNGGGDPISYHIAGGYEAALERAAECADNWTDIARPMVPTQETHLCWTADCDGCGREYDEDEIGAKAHIPGDATGPEAGALDGVFTKTDDGLLLCGNCCWDPGLNPTPDQLEIKVAP